MFSKSLIQIRLFTIPRYPVCNYTFPKRKKEKSKDDDMSKNTKREEKVRDSKENPENHHIIVEHPIVSS